MRAHALAGEMSGWRLGLSLFQGRGMATWLAACRDTTPPPPPSPTRSSTGGAGDELVGVLATMALAALGR
ncbi:MAG: hypothetical protein M3N98_05935 [Actinomycetota bacterium]|nr:hypothetical protein [Actinomycetota bacterium]